jgi:hypothetical protein
VEVQVLLSAPKTSRLKLAPFSQNRAAFFIVKNAVILMFLQGETGSFLSVSTTFFGIVVRDSHVKAVFGRFRCTYRQPHENRFTFCIFHAGESVSEKRDSRMAYRFSRVVHFPGVKQAKQLTVSAGAGYHYCK